jgi:hypothetical protein
MFDVYGGQPKFLVSFYIGELQLSVILYAWSRAPRVGGQLEIVAPCIVYGGKFGDQLYRLWHARSCHINFSFHLIYSYAVKLKKNLKSVDILHESHVRC